MSSNQKRTSILIVSIILILISFWLWPFCREKWLEAEDARRSPEYAAFLRLPAERRRVIEEGEKQRAFYFREGTISPDVERAKRELARDSNDEMALKTLMQDAMNEGYYNRAIGILKKLMIIDPKNSFYPSECGTAYRFVGNNSDAKAMFDKSVSLGGHYGELSKLGLEDMIKSPDLRQDGCKDCTSKP